MPSGYKMAFSTGTLLVEVQHWQANMLQQTSAEPRTVLDTASLTEPLLGVLLRLVEDDIDSDQCSRWCRLQYGLLRRSPLAAAFVVLLLYCLCRQLGQESVLTDVSKASKRSLPDLLHITTSAFSLPAALRLRFASESGTALLLKVLLSLLHTSAAECLSDSAFHTLLPSSVGARTMVSLLSASASYVLRRDKDAVIFFLASIRSGNVSILSYW